MWPWVVWASPTILSDCFYSERTDMVTVIMAMVMLGMGAMVKVTVMDFKKMIHRISRSRKKAKG